MATYSIRGLQVDFPYKAYPCQLNIHNLGMRFLAHGDVHGQGALGGRNIINEHGLACNVLVPAVMALGGLDITCDAFFGGWSRNDRAYSSRTANCGTGTDKTRFSHILDRFLEIPFQQVGSRFLAVRGTGAHVRDWREIIIKRIHGGIDCSFIPVLADQGRFHRTSSFWYCRHATIRNSRLDHLAVFDTHSQATTDR